MTAYSDSSMTEKGFMTRRISLLSGAPIRRSVMIMMEITEKKIKIMANISFTAVTFSSGLSCP